MLWCLLRQLLQAGVEDSLCYRDSRGSYVISLLQRFLRPHRGRLFLAIDGLLPDRDAHCSNETAQVFVQVDMAENTELGLLDRFAHCRCWIDSRTDPKPQDIQAVPDMIE
ncbi:hypothetical protein V6N11_003594 [Hibiscus sabdariffa]|uniref:Uncharacterized protein n=1 Tax=Hibiscus sabdariffa TaxID=183260 RepID=A0ABR2SDR1_9ROSI